MRRVVRTVAAAVLVLGSAAGAVHAQSGWRAGAGATFESYFFGSPDEVDLDRITLLTVPLGVDIRLVRNVDVRVASAFAHGELTRADGGTATLSGLTDTEVRVTLGLRGDMLRLSAIGLLPTGVRELTAAEMDVAGVVAADLLPFAISNWGTGGGVGLSAAAALPLSAGTALGLSAGYVLAREFEPLAETSFAYRPGSQLHVRAAVDQSIGSAGKASLQLVFQRFGTDEAQGANIYQAGDRMQVVGSYAFAAGASGSGIAYAGYLRRSEGEYTTAVRVTPAQDLIYGGVGFRLPFGSLVVLPTLDARVLGNEDGVDQGYTLSAGAGAEIPLGAARIVPHLRARYGALTIRSGQDSGFTGVDVGLSVGAGTIR
jgi:hypothetical protein